MLRFHSSEAAVLLTDGGKPVQVGSRVAFVGGYSVLNSLRNTPPKDSYTALFQPCEGSMVQIPSLDSKAALGDLLLQFRRERFGFAEVNNGPMFAAVGLSDVLRLYREGMLGSDLPVAEVATPRISLGRETPLREAISVMLERRIRRVFIRGTDAFVSDREIVSHIFSPRELLETKDSPSSMLEGKLADVVPVEPQKVDPDMTLREAARLITQLQGGALMCDGGVISPWDIVMKPFVTGHLNVK